MLGAACVVLGLLIILIAFLVKKDQISSNLKETAFFDRVFGTTPTFISEQDGKSKPSVTTDGDSVILNLKGNPIDASEADCSAEESSSSEDKITINQLKGQEKEPENPDDFYNRPAVEEDAPVAAPAPVKTVDCADVRLTFVAHSPQRAYGAIIGPVFADG